MQIIGSFKYFYVIFKKQQGKKTLLLYIHNEFKSNWGSKSLTLLSTFEWDGIEEKRWNLSTYEGKVSEFLSCFDYNKNLMFEFIDCELLESGVCAIKSWEELSFGS